jgi:hypothetical protein
VNVLLVGCAGRGLAVEFGETLKLRHCALTYVDGADMPRWGQLGCQGFIVLDGAGAVVCKTTPAFLEVEDLAFGFVESVVAALLARKPVPAVCPGVLVRLAGLAAAPELNGQTAMCVKAPGADGRCGVALRDGRRVSVRAEHVEPVGEMAAELAAANARDGGCCGGGCGGCAEPAEARAEALAEAPAAPAAPAKKEIFVGGVSMGVCANAMCLCMDCECGAGCQCNVGENSGVVQEGTCDPCSDFRKHKAEELAASVAEPAPLEVGGPVPVAIRYRAPAKKHATALAALVLAEFDDFEVAVDEVEIVEGAFEVDVAGRLVYCDHSPADREKEGRGRCRSADDRAAVVSAIRALVR